MDLVDWVPFFTAAAGASAALVGLLIVAMSVNVEAIVAIPSMPARASATIAGLTVVVVVAVLGIVPRIGAAWLGLILLVCALAALALAVDAAVRMLRTRQGQGAGASEASMLVRGVIGAVPVVVLAIAGLLLLAGVDAAGLVLTAIGFALVFITSVLNAWVLLIEIRR